MQLEEAASRIRQLSNFFDGLKYLEEVVEAARSADQLQKERNALAVQAGRELAAVQEKLSREKAEASSAIAKLKDDHARLSAAYVDKGRELEDVFKRRHEQLSKDIHDLEAQREQSGKALEEAVAEMLAKKVELQADIDKLEKALSTLKSKVGGML